MILKFVLLLIFSTQGLLCQPAANITPKEQEFVISTTWNGQDIPLDDFVTINLKGVENSRDVLFHVSSKFYDDPKPDGEPGQPFSGLWDYEVVEVFFLNDNNQYLEVEIGPHGHHIVLFMNGERNTIRHSLPMQVKTSIQGNAWLGEAVIPGEYFPPQMTKLNAYAINGVGANRRYLSLYPTDGSTQNPDFHNLGFFQPIGISSINPLLSEQIEMSTIWKSAIETLFHYEITRLHNNAPSDLPPTFVSLQGYEKGVEINFTMPKTSKLPPRFFMVAFANANDEVLRLDLSLNGSYKKRFLIENVVQISEEREDLDYKIDNSNEMYVVGSAFVEPSYFPPKVSLVNMYAVFGPDDRLTAMSLRPSVSSTNLNGIRHFTKIDFDHLVLANVEYSNVWKEILTDDYLLRDTSQSEIATENPTKEIEFTTAFDTSNGEITTITPLNNEVITTIDSVNNFDIQNEGMENFGITERIDIDQTTDIPNEEIETTSTAFVDEITTVAIEETTIEDQAETFNKQKTELKSNKNDEQTKTTPKTTTALIETTTPKSTTVNTTQQSVNVTSTTESSPSLPLEEERSNPKPVREDSPRRFEESLPEVNELPLDIKTSHKSQLLDAIEELIKPKIPIRGLQRQPLPQQTNEKTIIEIIEEIPTIALPLLPPHPLCFVEGLVPDETYCQLFYECVINSNGDWEVYKWRCRRGMYFDPVNVACNKGYCL